MKFTKKTIILASVGAVCLALLIAANVVISTFWGFLMFNFAKANTDFETEEAKNALLLGDASVQEIAEDSMVLLKNSEKDGKPVLPLEENNRRVNLFGYGSTENGFVYAGGGSSGTVLNEEGSLEITTYKRSPGKAFEEEGFEYNKGLEALYNDYSSYVATRSRGIANIVCPPAEFYTRTVLRQAIGFSDTAVVFISRNASESTEIPLYQPKDKLATDSSRTYLQLTVEEENMLDVVCDNFDKVIVVLNTGNRFETGFLNDYRIDAAFYAGIPGQSGLLALPRMLKGYKVEKGADGEEKKTAVTPSGKLADTYAYSTREYNPTDVNMFPTPSTHGDITYAENIYVGYRWYETADAEGYFDEVENSYGKGYKGVVQYPFGYGLSYTKFKWTVKDISLAAGSQLKADSKIDVTVTVVNDGEKAGKDVVAIYSSPQYYEGEIEKAAVNLVAFAKTKLLEPNHSQDVVLSFTAYDLASYDAYDKNNNKNAGYELDRGEYKLQLMTDAHTLAECENNVITYNVPETVNIKKDPVTGETVENRFTGSTAYMGVPIDASTLEGGANFMTRANGFKDSFPKTRGKNHRSEAAAKTANEAYNTRYDTTEFPATKNDSGLRFVTRADGANATLADLKGTTKAELKYDEALMTELGKNYDSPKWGKILDQMSPEDYRTMVYSGGFITAAIESVGKPQTSDSDGPAGFHAGQPEAEDKGKWTAFPAQALIGCCWNPETAYNMGRAQGTIGSNTGVQGWYAPGLNLHRNPYSARYFEYYSEDSALTGVLAAEVIRGTTNLGVHCYMKHFAVSEEGINPDNVMTWHTEQMLREIYLRPFEIAVKKGGANGVMTSFNCIGAVWAGACDAMNNDILRTEWGFRGALLSDWSSGRPFMNAEQGIRGGNDFMLDPSNNGFSKININDATTQNMARLASKNIMYMWANTWAVAKEYAEKGEDDRYTANLGVVISEDLFSPIPVVMLVAANVVFGGGLVACAAFIFIKPKAKKGD